MDHGQRCALRPRAYTRPLALHVRLLSVPRIHVSSRFLRTLTLPFSCLIGLLWIVGHVGRIHRRTRRIRRALLACQRTRACLQNSRSLALQLQLSSSAGGIAGHRAKPKLFNLR